MDLSDTSSLHRKPLAYFGKEVVESARDCSIREVDGLVDGSSVAPGEARIHQELARLTPEARDVIKKLVPLIVDTTLHHVMWMFEHPTHHGIRISVTMPDGETFPDLNAVSDGLAGDLIAWTQAYSKQRCTTPLAARIEVPDLGDLDDDGDEAVRG